ncbi:MAG: pyruvate formate-lyase-activating protein [Actinomycetaceae bacterium]|nr:pyruvate formate-lyase-activating protein [Actinomycetaceae bacterium]
MTSTLAGGATWVSEGSTGQYRPLPLEVEVPRMKGAGLAGVSGAPQMSRKEHLLAVRSGEIGSVHSWELVTSVDGPGTRLTMFLAGCPLRCLYCHNPDTLKMRDGEAVFAADLIQRMERYRPVFRATGGGITVSGGEPAMQPAFLARLLRAAKERDIHTCIDTSGFLGRNVTDQMLTDIDLVLLDVKSGTEQTYRKVTGRPLAPTLEFGQRLQRAGKPVWIRFVLVPGLTDAPDNIRAVAKTVAKWDNVARVEVLPFHQMGRDKWADLGMDYQLEDVEPPEKDQVAAARQIFSDAGIAQVF